MSSQQWNFTKPSKRFRFLLCLQERAVKNNDWLVYADAGNLRAPALFWKQLGQNALVSPTRRALYPNVRRSAAKKPDTREAKDKDDEARPGFHVKPEGDYVVGNQVYNVFF